MTFPCAIFAYQILAHSMVIQKWCRWKGEEKEELDKKNNNSYTNDHPKHILRCRNFEVFSTLFVRLLPVKWFKLMCSHMAFEFSVKWLKKENNKFVLAEGERKRLEKETNSLGLASWFILSVKKAQELFFSIFAFFASSFRSISEVKIKSITNKFRSVQPNNTIKIWWACSFSLFYV